MPISVIRKFRQHSNKNDCITNEFFMNSGRFAQFDGITGATAQTKTHRTGVVSTD